MVNVKKDGVRKEEFTGEYFGLVPGRTFLLKSTVVLITEEREGHIKGHCCVFGRNVENGVRGLGKRGN